MRFAESEENVSLVQDLCLQASKYLRNVTETYYILDHHSQEYILRLGDVNMVELS